ncbi:GHKL domain-containing protein [uncultured Tyzzerella sp.]|uniref:GHKL domain-containing protein n=1 Tax=uncultured Tyzzerella sp. TaxID=2321398 RepID=UPI0029420DC3|nr:GHKL domain-containing protein [uncultured Tyzzerella sp.]
MREASSFLDPIGFFLLLIGNLFFSLIVLKRWKGRILNILLPVIYPVTCTASVIFTAKSLTVANEPASYIVLFIVSMVLLIFLVKIRLEEAIFLSIFQTFHIVFSKSLAAGLLSLFYEKNMFQLFQVDQYTQLITCFAHGILATLFCIYYLAFNSKRISAFFLCKGQVYYVMIIHIMLALYLLFNCYNFYFNLDLIWFSVEQVYTCLVLYAVYFLVLRFGVRMSSLLQNEIRNKKQDFTILQQVSNFVAAEKSNEFLSLYSTSSVSLKELINSDNKIDSLEEIKKLDNKLKTIINEDNNTVSSSKTINSLFYEFNNICNFKQINFEGNYYFGNNIDIEEKDLHQILSILLTNALEASLKLPENSKKTISLSTEQKDENFILKISNTYNKKPKVDNGYLESSKRYTEIEGLGIGYVVQVLSKNKGKFNFKIDYKNKIFIAEVKLKIKK